MRNHIFKLGESLAVLCVVVTVILFPITLCAQEDLERPPPLPPEDAQDVPIPPKIQDEMIEPTVTIREEEGRRVEEYRLNGRVYMVKVTPDNGIPYYYMDEDGDGRLELDTTRGALNPVAPVHWKVKEWK